MASISLGEIASITKKAVEIISALASAPADLRKAQVKVSALKIYLSAISRERHNPASTLNKSASIRRDAELLLGFCMAQLECVHAISRKYAGKGASMDLWTRTKWIAGDRQAWAEALSELEELRVELREYVRDVCIGVIGVNAVEAALDETDDEEKAVSTAIAKKNRKHPGRAVSAEERAELVQFAKTVTAQRKPAPNPTPNNNSGGGGGGGSSAKPKPRPAASAPRLECWVLRTRSSPTGVTKTWKQEKRAQCTLRQTAKELREAASAKTITTGSDEAVVTLLKEKDTKGKEAKQKDAKEKDTKEKVTKDKDAKQKDPKEKDGDKKGKDKEENKPKAPPAPKKPQADCRYGSECTALDCRYKHPQRGPCRYGEDCYNDKCGFEHGVRQCKFKVCRKAGCTFKHRAGQRGKVKDST
ncbi:hypothetical protein BU16DRAFT_5939 [Lophium mytilinum]|uniref:C3H1-type domain-containing protein n=1 Tax=Lophium mytilinum TaxID=390894 RepID=A0A6A6RF28_9PEZI|nr:hypothetical protein BU16DRAFT_5939 [Lophium mytilinum]